MCVYVFATLGAKLRGRFERLSILGLEIYMGNGRLRCKRGTIRYICRVLLTVILFAVRYT
jgi:hypothetical protein